MTFDPNVLAHVFSISLTPAFLLAGTGGILAVISSRLTLSVERSRNLNRETKDKGIQESYALEIKMLDKDCVLLAYSLMFSSASALFTSLVIATLFCGQLISFGYSAEVIASILFAAATLSLSISIIYLFCSILNGKRLLFAMTKLSHS